MVSFYLSLNLLMEDNMAGLYGYCRKSTEKQNEISFEVQERKKILKKLILMLDEYYTFMIEYMCRGKGKEFLPKKS